MLIVIGCSEVGVYDPAEAAKETGENAQKKNVKAAVKIIFKCFFEFPHTVFPPICEKIPIFAQITFQL